MIAGTPAYGRQSGLGMLYEFLKMPESRIAVDSRGDALSIAMRGLSAYIRNPTGWSSFQDEMARACFIPQIAETGRAHNGLGYVNGATDLCLRAVLVMRMESGGVSFNADRERNWLDGTAEGAGLGVSFSTDLGKWWNELREAGGFNQGLSAGNSLDLFASLIDSQVKACEAALKEIAQLGCVQ